WLLPRTWRRAPQAAAPARWGARSSAIIAPLQAPKQTAGAAAPDGRAPARDSVEELDPGSLELAHGGGEQGLLAQGAAVEGGDDLGIALGGSLEHERLQRRLGLLPRRGPLAQQLPRVLEVLLLERHPVSLDALEVLSGPQRRVDLVAQRLVRTAIAGVLERRREPARTGLVAR